MHIPDGFLDTKTWVSLSAVSAIAVAISVAKTKGKLRDKNIPMMGIVSAFIFVAQMLNFPIAFGTSGHFMGAALAAILLGPYSAVLIMSTVLILQCLLFQDGGLTTLGANIFNMAIVGVFTAYLTNRLIAGREKKGFRFYSGAFLASWLSIVLASAICAVELAISGTSPLAAALPAMTGIHAFIGLVEGGITVSALAFIMKVRVDLLHLEHI